MYPYFTIFGKTIGLYPLISVIGVLLALFFAYRTAEKNKLDEIKMLFLMLIAYGGGVIGAHILYGLVGFDQIIWFVRNINSIDSFGTFINRIVAIFGGGVFYGGLLGGMAAGAIYFKKASLNAEYADIAITSVPLFHVFGRIGCFMGGCCYGIESSFGFTYTRALVPEANGVSRFPVQLLESLLCLLLFLAMYFLIKRRLLCGKLVPFYFISYGIIRFSLEFLRGDEIRGRWLIFSTSQWISIVLIIVGIIWLALKVREKTADITNSDNASVMSDNEKSS